MTKEKTFIAIKPDGVQRGYIAEIIGRFEKKGFKLVGLKQLIPSKDLAENHYGVHRERPFFGDLVEFISSGPVVAMVWEGEGVILSARKLIGATKPLEAEPGTIRGDLAMILGGILFMVLMEKILQNLKLICGLTKRNYVSGKLLTRNGDLKIKI